MSSPGACAGLRREGHAPRHLKHALRTLTSKTQGAESDAVRSRIRRNVPPPGPSASVKPVHSCARRAAASRRWWSFCGAVQPRAHRSERQEAGEIAERIAACVTTE